MKLYFTRHGKTEWNQQKRFQGMTGDSPLLPTSYDEIKQLGQYLQDIPFEKNLFESAITCQKYCAGNSTRIDSSS